MIKIFMHTRITHEKNLLDILGCIANAQNPISPFAIRKMLGEEKAYSGVHKNVAFLEKRGFVACEKYEDGRKRKLCECTVKGALASLFSSTLQRDASELLEGWRQKDWGPGYHQPFRNIRDVSELKKLVDNFCSHVGSLEEVSEDILKHGLRNPEYTMNMVVNATLTFEKTIEENGKYKLTPTYIPGSVTTVFVERTDGSKNVYFQVAPEEKTSTILFDYLLKDPQRKEQFEVYLQKMLQAIARDLDEGEGGVSSYYFSNSRTFVLAATLPEKVASLLKYPEQVLEFTKNSYNDIVERLRNEEFVRGNESWFNFRALKYDPKRRDLSPLSKDEIREKAHKILKNYSNVEI